MAGYRKLGRTSSQRKALIRSQVTALLHNGKIVTTEARAKEIRKVAEGLIALAVKEKDNFETVKVTAKVARKDKDGKEVLMSFLFCFISQFGFSFFVSCSLTFFFFMDISLFFILIFGKRWWYTKSIKIGCR